LFFNISKRSIKYLATKIYANAKLIEGFQILLDDNESHSYVTDLAPDLGTGLGASSLELCVMSHAGCYAAIFLLTAKKMRLKIKSLKVKLEATKSEETGTIDEESFDIDIKSDAPSDRIDRAHKLTLETCPVGILFEKAGVKATYKVTTSME
jgi:uncharacterized OsmC-like protein